MSATARNIDEAPWRAAPAPSSAPAEQGVAGDDAATPEAEGATEERAAPRLAGSPRRRLLWRAFGWLMFGVGAVGLALPVLPTTGFWILAVLAFDRSDPRLSARIRAWPKAGVAVANFLDHGVIAPAGKRAALGAMAVSALLCAYFMANGVSLWLALGGIAFGAIFVATRRSSIPVEPTAQER